MLFFLTQHTAFIFIFKTKSCASSDFLLYGNRWDTIGSPVTNEINWMDKLGTTSSFAIQGAMNIVAAMSQFVSGYLI